jgi:hypothetical protein
MLQRRARTRKSDSRVSSFLLHLPLAISDLISESHLTNVNINCSYITGSYYEFIDCGMK